MKNNFQKLEEEIIQQYGEPPMKIKENIDNTVGIFGIFSVIIDLFITKMINTIVCMSQMSDHAKNKNID